MESDEDKLRRFLLYHSSTKWIRLQWIDFSGVLRTRFVPTERCLHIAQGKEVYHLQQVCMIAPISTAPVCFPATNEIELWALRPDWSSLRICGFRNGHASVMCFIEHMGIGNPYRTCPRALLSGTLKELDKAWGVNVAIGFEIECMLLDQNSQSLDQLDKLNSYQTTNGLRSRTLDLIDRIMDILKRSSVTIHHFHTKTRDQIEFALSPEEPLKAIDSLVLAQETIRTVFIRHNIKATMTPKPVLDGPTNGIYLQMSLDGLPPSDTNRFLAGILNHMHSLCAFGMANFDGYVRNVGGAAGSWIGYGTENRELPVRKINEAHWEIRMMDGTANPYLFTAAVLLAGLSDVSDGEHEEIAWKDCRVYPDSLGEKERARFGLNKRMPSSLQETIDALKANDKAKIWMPEALLNAYVSVKEKEVEMFQRMSHQQRCLRFLEYF